MKIISDNKFININSGHDEIDVDYDYGERKKVIMVSVISYGELASTAGDIVLERFFNVDYCYDFHAAFDLFEELLADGFAKDFINLDFIEDEIKRKF